MKRILLVAVFCIICAFSEGAEWNYTDQGSWPDVCNLASSKKQTPIDINTTAAEYNMSLGAFTLKNFDVAPANNQFTASNNGHGLKFSCPERFYNVSGGGLTGVFTTAQFHLHWGSDNTKGSEHYLDGQKFAAELHFVNYNTKYADLGTAADKPDGLAVLGVFIEVGGDNNTAYSFLDHAKDVVYKDDKKTGIAAFQFLPMLPANHTKYFRYSGGLTTPPCYESVTWTVFKDPVKISQYQMEQLRMLKDAKNMTLENNYREIQPLNARKVMVSFDQTTEPPASSTTKAPVTPVPTADASAIKVTAGLFLLMLIAAIFVR